MMGVMDRLFRTAGGGVLEALRKANDPAVDQWVVDLANHYDKLDVCRGATAKRKR